MGSGDVGEIRIEIVINNEVVYNHSCDDTSCGEEIFGDGLHFPPVERTGEAVSVFEF